MIQSRLTRFHFKITGAVFIVAGLLIFATWHLYQHQTQQLTDRLYQTEARNLQMQANRLVEQQQRTSAAILKTFLQNPRLYQQLNQPCCDNALGLAEFVDILDESLGLRYLWIQVIDRQLMSQERSWLAEGGELINHRSDVIAVMSGQYPLGFSHFAVGVHNVTLRTLMPVYDPVDTQKVAGVIEVISHFEALIDQLAQQGIDSLVLATPAYQTQLSASRSNYFLQNHYVVNPSKLETFGEIVASHDLAGTLDQLVRGWQPMSSASLNKTGYPKLVTALPVYSFDNALLGYWVLGRDMSASDFVELQSVNLTYALVTFGLTAFIVIASLLFLLQMNISKQKRYFRALIDSSKDLLLVHDGQKLVDANAAFFKFFGDLPDLAHFQSRYGDITHFFEQGPGLFTANNLIEGWWLYILHRPDQSFKVKIHYRQRDYFYELNVVSLSGHADDLFFISMHDISDLERVRLQLERDSLTDTLTGVGNRQQFNLTLAQEIERSTRYESPFCIIALDIDYFKNINDQFGHAAGDKVLQKLAQFVKSTIRTSDSICRIGGEEFVIILPMMTLPHAQQLGFRLAYDIAHYDFNVPGLEKVTCSFGVAQWQADEAAGELLQRADKALYQAKASGRNTVMIAES